MVGPPIPTLHTTGGSGGRTHELGAVEGESQRSPPGPLRKGSLYKLLGPGGLEGVRSGANAACQLPAYPACMLWLPSSFNYV